MWDVIVVGVGAMGSSACWHLARRGVRVLGIDRFSIPNAMGSSHGDSRMIRLCYYEHPDYVPLLHRAYELWRETEQISKRKLLHVTGGLYMGPADTARSDFVTGALQAARQHQLPHEVLDRASIASRYPQFHVPDDFIALYEPNAGFLVPEHVVATHAELALRHGAELRAHEPLQHWRQERDHISIQTARGEERARHVIFCGGAWAASLMPNLTTPLRVTRQILGWVWPRRPELFTLGRFPVWAIDQPDGTQHYGFPIPDQPLGPPGFKIAHHHKGTPTTADQLDRHVAPVDEADFRWVLDRYIPDASGPLIAMKVCMYTNSPDSHFVIDQPAEYEGHVTVACGFSGHGFKFASVIGEALADLALNHNTTLPIEFLRPR